MRIDFVKEIIDDFDDSSFYGVVVGESLLECLIKKRRNWRGWWYVFFVDFYWKGKERNGVLIGGLCDIKRVLKMCKIMLCFYVNEKELIEMENWWSRKEGVVFLNVLEEK